MCFSALFVCLLLPVLASCQHVPSLQQVLERVPQHISASLHAQHLYSEIANLDISQVIGHSHDDKEFMETIVSLLKEEGNSSCYEDTLIFMRGLVEKQKWAFTFIDALGKLPSGFTLGDFAWLGQFSQCRAIHVPDPQINSSDVLFSGQYCLAYFGNTSQTFNAAGQMGYLKVGVCTPDSCTSKQVAGYLSKLVSLVTSQYGVMTVDCKPNRKPPFTSGAIAVIVLLSVWASLVLCGTIYDLLVHRWPIIGRQDSDILESDDTSPNVDEAQLIPPAVRAPTHAMFGRILLCFSVVENGSKILNTQTDGRTLSALHGIRFLSMTWIILGHTMAFLMFSAISNPLDLFDAVKRFSFQTILNATVAVDTFFLVSGLLASYLLLNQMEKSGGPSKINWFLVYFHRFWRLTPSYMMVIAISTTLFHYMGSGPLYPETSDAVCSKYWWRNLLYISNLFPSSEECIAWSWYLANDMQFFIISPLVLVLLYKWFVAGIVVSGALILVNILTVSILTLQNNLPADIGAMNFTDSDSFAVMKMFDEVYIRPYCRVGVYSIGLLLGYLMHRLGSNVRLHWVVVALGWLLAAVCNYSVVYGLYGVAGGTRALSHNVTAFYASIHRIAWGVGLSWVIFACFTGHGGPVNKLLSWSVFIPLSRLTYMAYLVHPLVMTWVNTSAERPFFFSDSNLVYLFLSDAVLSYAVAFVLSLTLESPMISLEKLFLPQKNRR